ncbi:4270_t:CDS:2, partial [Ambispora gerdemannii]
SNNRWFKYLLEVNDQCHKYSKSGCSIFVREETNSLQILLQYLRSPDEINKNSVYLALKVTGMENEVEYYNKREDNDFLKSITGADLIGGVNQEEL